jgi:hypothetical protein
VRSTLAGKGFAALFQKRARIQRRGALVAARTRRNLLFGVFLFAELKKALALFSRALRGMFSFCAYNVKRKSG